MKTRLMISILLIALLAISVTAAVAGQATGVDSQGIENAWDYAATCTSIQSGELVGSDGVVLTVGFDKWGYHYQAHLFDGLYCDAYRNADWCQPYEDVNLMMKWNDAWLSNEDCDGDGLLDRHFGFASYIGSGAWLTNHQSGEYELDGQACTWYYFVKIVAAPADAWLDSEVWYAADGATIGPQIWGEFAIIQQIETDPCAGLHGVSYVGARPGLGTW